MEERYLAMFVDDHYYDTARKRVEPVSVAIIAVGHRSVVTGLTVSELRTAERTEFIVHILFYLEFNVGRIAFHYRIWREMECLCQTVGAGSPVFSVEPGFYRQPERFVGKYDIAD